MPISMLAPGGAANKSFECRSFNVYVSSDDGIISNVVNFDVTDLLNMGCTFLGGASAGLDNFTATANPTTADDVTNGYAAGSRWINTTSGLLFTCLDASEGAAEWAINASIVNNTLSLGDNLANALDFAEGTSSYLKFVTTDNSEQIQAGKIFNFTAGVMFGGIEANNVINLTTNLGTALNITDGVVNFLGFTTTTGTPSVSLSVDLSVSDGKNIAFKATTGTKIGTDPSQKFAFWNATPIAQPTAAATTTGFTAGSGTAMNDDSTSTGGVGSTAYTFGDVVRIAKELGLVAA